MQQPTRDAILCVTDAARSALLSRLGAPDDAALLERLRPLGVRALERERDTRERQAAWAARELLAAAARGEPMPLIVGGCPDWERRLRRERPEWATRLPRADGEDGPRRVTVTACAAAGPDGGALSAARLLSLLGERGPFAPAPAPAPRERGLRLRDALRHAAFLRTGRWPDEGLLRLRPSPLCALALEGEADVGGLSMRAALVCGAECALRYLEAAADGRRACQIVEVTACAGCRA